MGSDLGGLIEAEVKRAEDDVTAFRSRAISIVSLTGILVAGVSGLVAIAVGTSEDVLPRSGPPLLLVALVGYIAAAICALMVNLPGDVSASRADALEGFATNNWNDDGWDQQVSIMLTKYLVTLRVLSAKAACWLSWAIRCQIGGMVATALLGLAIVANAP